MRLSHQRLQEIRNHLCLPISRRCTKCELLAEIDYLTDSFLDIVRQNIYKKLLAAEQRIEKLRVALEWYSDGLYPGDESETEPGVLKSGKRARAALAADHN